METAILDIEKIMNKLRTAYFISFDCILCYKIKCTTTHYIIPISLQTQKSSQRFHSTLNLPHQSDLPNDIPILLDTLHNKFLLLTTSDNTSQASVDTHISTTSLPQETKLKGILKTRKQVHFRLPLSDSEMEPPPEMCFTEPTIETVSTDVRYSSTPNIHEMAQTSAYSSVTEFQEEWVQQSQFQAAAMPNTTLTQLSAKPKRRNRSLFTCFPFCKFKHTTQNESHDESYHVAITQPLSHRSTCYMDPRSPSPQTYKIYRL